MVPAHMASRNGHHPQSFCLLVGILSLTGWYPDTGSCSDSTWKPSWWLNPLFFVTPREQHCLELTLASWSPLKFSPPPLGSGQGYSRASLPASAGSFPWSHNQLPGGDCLIDGIIHWKKPTQPASPWMPSRCPRESVQIQGGFSFDFHSPVMG